MARVHRSSEWYGGDTRDAYIHRAWMRRGLPQHAFDGRPHIAIADTSSDLTPCNAHLGQLAEHVARGVWEAGGVPLRLPVMSLGETQVRPTAMLWRNLAAMSIEEMIRANPVDGVVLLGGCDKTIPSLLMGACSVDLPSVVLPGGPMITGHYRGQPLGCGTDVWRLSEEVRGGSMTAADFFETESSMIRSSGHCNTMGTASTMAVMAEALGMTIPGTAGMPAPDTRLRERAHESGKLIVEMVAADRTPSTVLTRESFRNAIVALAAVGGSTNAVLHLLAIAGPAGRFLMDDLFRAGGVLAVLKQVSDLLDGSAITVTGQPLLDSVMSSSVWDDEVIKPRADPVQLDAGIRVLRGNLAPLGAIIKPAAASAHLLTHRGRAVVFDSVEDLHARIDDRDLEIDETSVLVLRGCGPRGYPGMPEVGNLPIPRRLVETGVRDMVRISDGRMSGTAYGTVVLHVAPESACGGPLSRIRDGDPIELDVPKGIIRVDVKDLDDREPSAKAIAAYANPTRGWERLYVDHVMQADTGVDLDFLLGSSGSMVTRESH